jgi:hypothetical protein
MLNGYWLPKNIRKKVIGSETQFAAQSFHQGIPAQADTPGAIHARWPVFDLHTWKMMLTALSDNRQQAPKGVELWNRLHSAFMHVSRRLANPTDDLCMQILQALPNYTGYSPAMIQSVSQSFELFALEQMVLIQRSMPTYHMLLEWEKISGLPGRFRFFSESKWGKFLHFFPGYSRKPIFSLDQAPTTILGYGAGNVPGTALLIALLALSTSINANPAPITIIRNSRQEPLFSPLILQAIEEFDADLVSTLAVLVWDYEDDTIQDTLLHSSDLVIAAASDETINKIQVQIDQRNSTRKEQIRFIPHGHKVSFSTIFSDVLTPELHEPGIQTPILDIVCLLAGLDSIFWDQFGCLSSRFHFVEEKEMFEDFERSAAHRYAQKLNEQLSFLSQLLPRGNWPVQPLHDHFDAFKQLESSGKVRVYSQYDDLHLVIMDNRTLTTFELHRLINGCQGRIIIVRPVVDGLQVPRQYLKSLPATNLQSMSIACGHKDEGLTERLLQFASECGKCGVTSIRTVGRGAFPQLPYSWDGFIPLDLVGKRLPGHFSSIEFEKPMNQILETFDLLQKKVPLI